MRSSSDTLELPAALPAECCSTPEDEISALRERNAAVRRVFWITLALNFLVAGAKGIYSILSGSVTLGADAFHSVLDGSANVLALVGMHLSTAPTSAAHP
jgi:divalent metal cation (Fe/Co/Zn/Cd) transporter